MTTVFAVANQKGGVGKTTSSVNLAASLAATRKKVLLVDIDPQGNATTGSGVDKFETDYTIYDVLCDDVPIEQAVTGTPEESGFALIAANGDLTAAEVQLLDLKSKEFRLRNALARIRDDYDYILIDCPPSLNMLTVNALTAADSVIVPIQCEYYALEGLTALMNTIEKIRSVLNPKLHIGGLLAEPAGRQLARKVLDLLGHENEALNAPGLSPNELDPSRQRAATQGLDVEDFISLLTSADRLRKYNP